MAKTGKELGELAWEMWGSKGVPVFPCKADKKPLTARGFLDASTTKADVVSMFETFGQDAVFIGGAMGGDSQLFAIDLDLYREDARAYKAILEASGQLVPTRVHRTPKGGEHWLYFVPEGASEVKSSKPHPGVDIKGTGGYIILPGSPNYDIHSSETAEAPTELVNRLTRAANAFKEMGVEALENQILSGDNFHDAAAMLAAKWAGSGMETTEVQKRLLALLEGSVAASPHHERHDRWAYVMGNKGKELSRIAISAYNKFNPNRGERLLAEHRFPDGPFPSNSETRPVEPPVEETTDPPEFPFARSYAAAEVEEQDDSTFIIYPLIRERDVIVLSAAPKAGKTLVSMTMCLHAAAGIGFADDLLPLDKEGERVPLSIIYFALEGQGAIRKRIKAWLITQNLEREADGRDKIVLADLHIYVVESPINLTDSKVKQVIADKLLQANIYFQKIGWRPTDLIVFDTLTKTMPGKDQNSVDDTSAVFAITEMIRENGMNTAIMFVHHNSKEGGAPRGSSNIMAEPDTVLSVEKMPDSVIGGRLVKSVQLLVHMARAIDDTQKYLFEIGGVNIGVNTQGIEEIAPVVTMLDGAMGSRTVDEEMLVGIMEASKTEFFDYFVSVLSTTNNMVLAELDRNIRTTGPAGALKYYSSIVPNVNPAVVESGWQKIAQEKHTVMTGMRLKILPEGGTVIAALQITDEGDDHDFLASLEA